MKKDEPMSKKNIFVVRLDEFNRKRLDSIRHAEDYEFHAAVDLKKIQGADEYPLQKWLLKAENRMDAFEGSVDAVIGFWDFPVSPMVPILCERYGTVGPSLYSVLKCEHKYWSRLEQARIIGEHIPKFEAVNPFDDEAADNLSLEYPIWLKPVKAFASQLGFYITNQQELDEALEKLRSGIKKFAEPFNTVLERVELPREVSAVDGYSCVAEEIMSGHQCTISGYAVNGDIKTYGLIDSINYEDSSSFFRYQYPSNMTEDLHKRMEDISLDVMRHMGFHNSPFNIEYFYDEKKDHVWLLEINTRISQSHSYLFEQVDGASNHQVLVELALGNPPEFPRGEGDHKICNKLHLRHFSDGVVRRVPTQQDIVKVRKKYPDARVLVQVEEGQRLSEMTDQDSYSYRLGVVYMAGDAEAEVMEKYHDTVKLLGFEIDDLEKSG